MGGRKKAFSATRPTRADRWAPVRWPEKLRRHSDPRFHGLTTARPSPSSSPLSRVEGFFIPDLRHPSSWGREDRATPVEKWQAENAAETWAWFADDSIL